MKFKIILIFSAIFLYSCKCGKNVKLGEFKLTDASIHFIPYTGMETLIFEDNHGVEHRLKSKLGIDLQDAVILVRTICDEGVFDKQYQYYDTQREAITFLDSIGKQIFYVQLITQFEDAKDLDSIAIYDFLTVDGSINGHFNGEIEIITEERQNHVTDFHRNEFLSQSDFVGDTILYGKTFTDVFKSTNGEGRSIFYNKEKGVVAFKMTAEEYWVLK